MISNHTSASGVLLLWLLVATSFSLSAPLAVATSDEAPSQPNVIVIMVDDMGYGGVSCFDNQHFETPEIDRLAADGIKLTDFHSNGSLCSPTRAALMTGRYQQRTGCDDVVNADPAEPMHHVGMHDREWTFAEAMKSAGYATGIFGKWHLGYKAEFNPLRHGFDEFNGFVSGNIDAHSHRDRMGVEDWWQGEERKDDPGYHTDLITKDAVDFIERHQAEPFFLYVAHAAPHSPHQARGSPILRGPEKGTMPPWAPEETYSEVPGEDDWLIRHFILPLDESVAHIRAKLEELGIAENTVLWFISDNGGTKGNSTTSPLTRGAKVDFYEGGHRVPGIVWAPGRIEAGGVSDETIMSFDIMPTSMALAGVDKSPRRLDGIDVSPALFDREALPERILFWNMWDRGALRDGDWKLVVMGPENELYNLRDDPQETKNLAAERPDRTRRMRGIYDSKLIETRMDSPYPLSKRNTGSLPGEAYVYKTVGESEISLRVLSPDGHSPDDPKAAIVFFFGGGWVGGNPGQFLQQAEELRSRGMVAILADYRVRSRQGTSPFESVEDGKSAVRWIREHADELGIDSDRIVAAGGSAGGHVAACAGIIDGFEAQNEDRSISSVPNAMILFNPVLDTTETGLGVDRVGQDRKFEVSPNHHIRPGIVPTLVLHGTADSTVPFENAERFQRLMKEAGNESELVSFEGKGHGFFNGSWYRPGNPDTSSYGKCMEASVAFLTRLGFLAEPLPSSRPNLVYILADDLGYGDVQCLNPERSKIETPRMDQLAAGGMIFTDAHTSSAVCTPSRYSILTGRYNWRTTLQAQVLDGYDLPMIDADRMTVADLLKEHGYNTACIGKWHLGLGMPTKGGAPMNLEGLTNVDWSGAITGGPVDLGFDYYYGISASLNFPPYIYMENDRFVGECTVIKGFNREGAAHEDFEAVETLPHLTRKAVDFINQQSPDKPFFLYVPLTSPHTPVVPSKEWQGKSEVGPYGDFVMQTDAVVGEIVDAIDAAGFGQNTIFILTSDNGFSKWGGLDRVLEAGHFPSAEYRGYKADIWEGGHRVPFIVRWPAVVEKGSRSDATFCLSDLIATCADILGTDLPDNAGEDSVSFLPALSGKPILSTRAGIVHHSFSGHFAYRMGKWKLLLAKSSGGWTPPTENQMPKDAIPAQLYDMDVDPEETTNLFMDRPDVVRWLIKHLEEDVRRGRSTAGPEQMNDTDEIVLWKSGR